MAAKQEKAYKEVLIAIADTLEEEGLMPRTVTNIRKAIITIEGTK